MGHAAVSIGDGSRNNWLVALLTMAKAGTTIIMHTQPRHGMDLHGTRSTSNWWGIRFLQFLGLARSIKFSLPHRFLA